MLLAIIIQNNIIHTVQDVGALHNYVQLILYHAVLVLFLFISHTARLVPLLCCRK